MAHAVAVPSWRDVDPLRIDTELAGLWRDVAGTAPINRALLSNLLVFSEQSESGPDPSGSLNPLLQELVCRHPCRVIVLQHRLGCAETCSPLEATIGVLTFGGNEARYGVEQIVVRSACADASLPSIVSRLLVGDVPTSLWWTEDCSRVAPIPALVAMVRQLVYDSRSWANVPRGVLALQPFLNDRVDLSDLNWSRLAVLRRPLQQAIAALAGRETVSADVRHGRADTAAASLLAGWLETRLAPGSSLRLLVDDSVPPRTVRVSLGAGTREIAATLASDGGDAEVLGAQLRALERDRSLHDTLRALTLRFNPGA